LKTVQQDSCFHFDNSITLSMTWAATSASLMVTKGRVG
jgi:hypothetical protein